MKIFNIRKKYLIPNKSQRLKDSYIVFDKNYSIVYALRSEYIKLFKDVKGVYELMILQYNLNKEVKYTTIYIGSSNNLKVRLSSYINGYAHTLKLKTFLVENIVYFRFIESDNYKILEKDVLDAFFSFFGKLPLLNFNRVL